MNNLTSRQKIMFGVYSMILAMIGVYMPNIKPISEMKNYTSIVNELSYGNRIYFTKNGHGSCALIDMKELDELDNLKAKLQLLTKLNEAKISIKDEGTISADDLEKELGL